MACQQETVTFNGCTAIITGRNNSGKTSLLRGLFNRLRGVKADDVITHGQTEGFSEYELTSGERLRWDFTDKPDKGFKEKLTYITDKDIKTALTTELRNRFAPETFDVDKFLASQPMAQRKTLQDLAGLDFTDIDKRYSEAYKERTAANTRSGDAKTLFDAAAPVPKIEIIDLAVLNGEKEEIRKSLNGQYLINKGKNDQARSQWNLECDTVRDEVTNFNNKQQAKKTIIDIEEKIHQKINDVLAVHPWFKDAINFGHISDYLKNLDQPELDKTYVAPPEPTYIQELPDNAPLLAVEEKITAAIAQNKEAEKYLSWLQLQTNKNTAAELATAANTKVQVIEQERMDLIKTANMPEGFSFTDDGIAYNGLSFTREQLSSSGIYIAALKLASMRMGEIRTLHFDASFLDKVSLLEIEKWAASMDLQLLIERPDFEAGDIRYEIVEAV